MSYNTPRRIPTQKGATAANKTFKPTLVEGGPLRGRIRFQGNVFKIEFLDALSRYVLRIVSGAKVTALTCLRSFPSSAFLQVIILALIHILCKVKHLTSLPDEHL